MVSGIYLAKVTRISSLRRKAKYNISEVAMCLYSCAMATVKNMREALHHQELDIRCNVFIVIKWLLAITDMVRSEKAVENK